MPGLSEKSRAEVRWAWRNLRARRSSAVLAVLLLAAAIAANVIVFASTDSLVFHRSLYPEPERLTQIANRRTPFLDTFTSASMLEEWRAQRHLVQERRRRPARLGFRGDLQRRERPAHPLGAGQEPLPGPLRPRRHQVPAPQLFVTRPGRREMALHETETGLRPRQARRHPGFGQGLEQARKNPLVVVHRARAIERIVHIAEVGDGVLQLRFRCFRQFGNIDPNVGGSVRYERALAARPAEHADAPSALIASDKSFARKNACSVHQFIEASNRDDASLAKCRVDDFGSAGQ